MLICVPSRNRVRLIQEKRGIWKYLDPRTTTYNLKVFVLEKDKEMYSHYIPIGNLISVPDIYYISDKRQAMLEYAIENEITHLFIIDDDIVLYHRDETLPSKYCCRFEEVKRLNSFNRMIQELKSICNETFPIVGVPLKQGSQSKNSEFEINAPIIRVVCYYVPILKRENIKINGLGVPFMSDRYTQLCLLKKGYKSLTHNGFAIDDYGTGKPGGCQETRTPELQSLSAKALANAFPESVTLKVKKGEGYWTEERLDCKLDLKYYIGYAESKISKNQLKEIYNV
ncbi:MAG: hypothetical protein QXO70_00930 [Candidatus Pacearchaeota archaeon]